MEPHVKKKKLLHGKKGLFIVHFTQTQDWLKSMFMKGWSISGSTKFLLEDGWGWVENLGVKTHNKGLGFSLRNWT